MDKPKTHVILASQSPRRKQLLEEAGLSVSVIKPPYDDPADPSEVTLDAASWYEAAEKDPDVKKERLVIDLAGQFACLLAERKLQSLVHQLVGQVRADQQNQLIIAADTVCVDQQHHQMETDQWQQALIGKPESVDEAREMLSRFSDRSHAVVSGVSVATIECEEGAAREGQLSAVQLTMHAFWDASTVHLGALATEEIEAYVTTDEWRGKAGAYNLKDRMAAGWPLSIDEDDDPTTVMGLPMRKLSKWLHAYALTTEMLAGQIG